MRGRRGCFDTYGELARSPWHNSTRFFVSVNSNAPLFLGKFKEDTGKISLKRYSKAGVFPNLGEKMRRTVGSLGLFQKGL